MGWSGSLTESSALGSAITFTPSTSAEGAYTVSSFTAPKKAIYRFQLYGSGGTKYGAGASKVGNVGGKIGGQNGAKGGYTDGYLLLEKGQTVYIGAGGTCSAAFVSAVTGAKLSAIAKANLYFVAGGGGAGCLYGDGGNETGSNCTTRNGTAGGGTTGATSEYPAVVGKPGTQTAGGAASDNYTGNTGAKAGSYGTGGASYGGGSTYTAYGGRGGDGLYGGGGGYAKAESNGMVAGGGGGGSGYVKTASFEVNGVTYTSSTTQGSGSAANSNGKVIVTYYAQAELPASYNGVKLTKITFDGTEIGSLIFNGTKLFIRRLKEVLSRWFTSTKAALRLRASI